MPGAVKEAYTPCHHVPEAKLEPLPGLFHDPEWDPHTRPWKLLSSSWSVQAVSLVKDLGSRQAGSVISWRGAQYSCRKLPVVSGVSTSQGFHCLWSLLMYWVVKKKRCLQKMWFFQLNNALWLSKVLILHIQHCTSVPLCCFQKWDCNCNSSSLLFCFSSAFYSAFWVPAVLHRAAGLHSLCGGLRGFAHHNHLAEGWQANPGQPRGDDWQHWLHQLLKDF